MGKKKKKSSKPKRDGVFVRFARRCAKYEKAKKPIVPKTRVERDNLARWEKNGLVQVKWDRIENGKGVKSLIVALSFKPTKTGRQVQQLYAE